MKVFEHLPEAERPELLHFCGFESKLEDADLVLFGAPFDSTSSFRSGSRLAPSEMRRDSWGLESWSPVLKRDLENCLVHDAGDLELPMGAAQEALRMVYQVVKALLDAGKRPLMIGGEHTLTLGAAEALLTGYPDLHILHLDAHSDLRMDYLGVKQSHATVIRRIYELTGKGRIHSLGIRSGLEEEFKFAERELDFHPFSLRDIDMVLETIADAPVYLTIDLDVLDPAFFPGTGTAEPGGVTYQELANAIYAMDSLNIVGCDLMELAPAVDPSGASTALACKILRELVLRISK